MIYLIVFILSWWSQQHFLCFVLNLLAVALFVPGENFNPFDATDLSFDTP